MTQDTKEFNAGSRRQSVFFTERVNPMAVSNCVQLGYSSWDRMASAQETTLSVVQ
jgi:hypothetical protein